MSIDIDGLTETELIDLNRRIVERLRFLHQARSHRRMLEFSVGERVCFDVEGRGTIVGMLVRYNKRTVTVITDDGNRWNVAPQLLQRVVESTSTHKHDPNVISIRKK